MKTEQPFGWFMKGPRQGLHTSKLLNNQATATTKTNTNYLRESFHRNEHPHSSFGDSNEILP